LPESVLTFGALGILEDLSDRRLPNIEISVTFEMCGCHFLMSISSHTPPPQGDRG
jgi:hypothetical protein